MSTQHLGDVLRFHGRGPLDATEDVEALFDACMAADKEAKRAEWAKTHPDGKTGPYATDVAQCDRKVYKSLKNEPREEDLNSEVDFGLGNAAEELFGAKLQAGGVTAYWEVRVAIPHMGTTISGRMDFLFFLSGRPLELKTTNSRSMGQMLRRQEPGRDSHRRQLNLYLHALKNGLLSSGEVPVQGTSDRGALLYIIKDGTKGEPRRHAWWVDYDEEQALADLTHLAEIANLAKRDMDPGIPVEFLKAFNTTKNRDPGWECRYCGYLRSCWNVNEGGWPISPKEA